MVRIAAFAAILALATCTSAAPVAQSQVIQPNTVLKPAVPGQQPGVAAHGQPVVAAHGQPGSAGQPGTAAHVQPGAAAHGQPGAAAHGQPVPAAGSHRYVQNSKLEQKKSTGISGSTSTFSKSESFTSTGPATQSGAQAGAQAGVQAGALSHANAAAKANTVPRPVQQVAVANGQPTVQHTARY